MYVIKTNQQSFVLNKASLYKRLLVRREELLNKASHGRPICVQVVVLFPREQYSLQRPKVPVHQELAAIQAPPKIYIYFFF